MVVIGIDLGTTNSCVAVFKDGNAIVLENAKGKRTIPSYVAFNGTEILIGKKAKKQSISNPRNTVFGMQRFIGRKIDDLEPIHWPFKVIAENDWPQIEVTFNGVEKRFSPEHFTSMILSELKKTAQNCLGETVKDAVITVPAHFNRAQRHATRDAATHAGLNVLRILSGSTAAALAYGFNMRNPVNILVFDFGGGSLDVSILKMKNGRFVVKSTASDAQLGGEDFDNAIVEYLADKFRQDKNVDNLAKTTYRKLKEEAERVKISLSSSLQTFVEIKSLADGKDFLMPLKRSTFEDICGTLFAEILHPVQKALADAKLGKSEIDEIFLVGGSTRIPKIRNLLSDFFDGKDLITFLNPDEVVVCGAAIQAAKLAHQSPELHDIFFVDVVPISLGIDVDGVFTEVMIPRNTAFPYFETKRFTNNFDWQEEIQFVVYEGESERSQYNNKLGEFILHIYPAPRGETKIDVELVIDVNSILTVQAHDLNSGRKSSIRII